MRFGVHTSVQAAGLSGTVWLARNKALQLSADRCISCWQHAQLLRWCWQGRATCRLAGTVLLAADDDSLLWGHSRLGWGRPGSGSRLRRAGRWGRLSILCAASSADLLRLQVAHLALQQGNCVLPPPQLCPLGCAACLIGCATCLALPQLRLQPSHFVLPPQVLCLALLQLQLIPLLPQGVSLRRHPNQLQLQLPRARPPAERAGRQGDLGAREDLGCCTRVASRPAGTARMGGAAAATGDTRSMCEGPGASRHLLRLRRGRLRPGWVAGAASSNAESSGRTSRPPEAERASLKHRKEPWREQNQSAALATTIWAVSCVLGTLRPGRAAAGLRCLLRPLPSPSLFTFVGHVVCHLLRRHAGRGYPANGEGLCIRGRGRRSVRRRRHPADAAELACRHPMLGPCKMMSSAGFEGGAVAPDLATAVVRGSGSGCPAAEELQALLRQGSPVKLGVNDRQSLSFSRLCLSFSQRQKSA